MLQRSGELPAVEPLDVTIGAGTQVLVISGPNAGGKTIALKTAGILTLMALCGMPVPADDSSTFPQASDILVDIGDEQSIQEKLSTFSAHVTRISAIIASAGHSSLVLLDELGAGTEPLQGAAIACGVLKTLKDKGASVIATTHLTEIVGYVQATGGMINAGMEFDNRSFTPLYRLVTGEPGQSHTLEIAGRFGMPQQVISFARQMLGSGGSEFAVIMAELRQTRVELESERRILAEQGLILTQKERELASREQAINEMQRNAVEKARNDALNIISTARRDFNRLQEEFRKERRKDIVEKVRQRERLLLETVDNMVPSGILAPEEQLTSPAIGDRVHVRSLGRDGELVQLDERHAKAKVRAGNMEIEVPLSALLRPKERNVKQQQKRQWRADVTSTTQSELMLVGCRTDEGIARLESFLNQTALTGIREIRIIHGSGTGRLRAVIREHLSRHPLVEAYRGGEPYEGREGATIVTLRD